jgi:uncharacterized protein YjbJ (UPF0337 family)
MDKKITVNWNEKKEKIKKKYPIITDNDLHLYEGKEKEMFENLGYKLGISKLELATTINAL